MRSHFIQAKSKYRVELQSLCMHACIRAKIVEWSKNFFLFCVCSAHKYQWCVQQAACSAYRRHKKKEEINKCFESNGVKSNNEAIEFYGSAALNLHACMYADFCLARKKCPKKVFKWQQ